MLECASSLSLEVAFLLLIISIVFDAHSPPTYVAHLLRLLLHVREVEEERVRVEHHPVVALAHRLRDVPRRLDPSQGDESRVGRDGLADELRDLASPSALMTADRLSCLAFSTMNLARSASCCATCLASMAAVYSRPKVSAVMDTSSRSMLKPAARWMSCERTARDTCSRWVMSCEALYCATTDLRVSWTMDGRTRSLKSVPRLR